MMDSVGTMRSSVIGHRSSVRPAQRREDVVQRAHEAGRPSRVNGIGGRIFRTFANGPSVPSRMPRSRMRLTTSDGFRGRGLERLAILHQLHAEEQPRPAHVADQRMARRSRAQPDRAARRRPRARAPAAAPPRPRRARRARPRTTTVLPPNVLKNSIPLSNDAAISRRRHHRAERIAVADRFAQHDDVGDDALRLERVEVRAHAAVARSALRPRCRRRRRRGRSRRPTADSRRAGRSARRRSGALSAMNARRDCATCLRELRVLLARARIVALVLAAIRVGHRQRRAPTAAPRPRPAR